MKHNYPRSNEFFKIRRLKTKKFRLLGQIARSKKLHDTDHLSKQLERIFLCEI